MSNLLKELGTICAELRSEKTTSRCKAAERLDQMLGVYGKEIVNLLKLNKSNGLSWNELFNDAVDATFKHASKLDDIKSSKCIQTIRNKNYLFSGIINKIIDLNLEDQNYFLSKSVIFNAFTEGLKMRVTINHFGLLFLNILDRGLYKSEVYVQEIKVNEFSRILSHLYEVNVNNDEILRFAVLKSIIRTIELAYEYVQLDADVIEYIPEILVFAKNATNDRRKEDVIKLFHLYVSQLAVDYHRTLCIEIQNILPVISGFYDTNLRSEIKDLFFHSIYLSMYAIYPQLDEGSFCTFNISLEDSWVTSLKKLRTIIDVEINERTIGLSRVKSNRNGNSYFEKMAACIHFLFHWHLDMMKPTSNNTDEMESDKKKPKPADTLEIYIKLMVPSYLKLDEIRFAVLAEIIKGYKVLNVANLQNILQIITVIINSSLNVNIIKQLRYIIESILETEELLISNLQINSDFCNKFWSQLVEWMLKDLSTTTEFMIQKQSLLQSLIRRKKLNADNCSKLIQIFVSNNSYERTECIQTVREVLENANILEIDKSGKDIGRLINWIHGINNRVNVLNVIQNIAPIDIKLIAETCSIAVVNFLFQEPLKNIVNDKEKNKNCNLKLLLFKYNKRLICIEEHAKNEDYLRIAEEVKKNANEKKIYCLIQTNYELLMRLFNYETTKATDYDDVYLDLHSFHKIITLMKKLIEYDVFDENNFTQCPLIKRIGLFLSHLELQLKSNNPKNIPSNISEILTTLKNILENFTDNAILLMYLEKQPLDELIKFIGALLIYSGKEDFDTDFENKNNIPLLCLNILSILCASETHFLDAFGQFEKYDIKMPSEINILFHMIQIFCNQRKCHISLADWFVNKLKAVFRLYYTDISVVKNIINIIPAIFQYVQGFDVSLENMLIALVSLLKIASKKSYSVHLTEKLIISVRVIAMNCKNIFKNENFKNVCISVAKFLSFSSLKIQFAAIQTICALMDGKCIILNSNINETYFMFCDEIYSHIDWKILSSVDLNNSTFDIKQNSTAVSVQVLTAIFAFSSYHQYNALHDLTYLCARRKLKESDVYAFNQVAVYYKCNIDEITRPFVQRILQTWIAKKYPILKFPYIIFHTTKDKFILSHLPTITSYLMLHTDIEEIKKLDKYGAYDELVKNALPLTSALYIPYVCNSEKSRSKEYSEYIKNLLTNNQKCGIQINNFDQHNSNTSWKIIFELFECFEDDIHYQKILGFRKINKAKTEWYTIDFNILEKCLRLYFNQSDRNGDTVLTNIFTKEPIILVYCLNEYKKLLSISNFIVDKLNYFFKFCTLTDIIIDSFSTNINSNTISNNNPSFFLRDAIFFSLSYLQSGTENTLQLAAINFLELLLQKSNVLIGSCLNVVKTYFNDIINSLVTAILKSSYTKIRQAGIHLLENIIIERYEKFADVFKFVDTFPNSSEFKKLYEHQILRQGPVTFNNGASFLNSFLNKKNSSVGGLQELRKYVSLYKTDIQKQGTTFLEIIAVLISIIRTTDLKELRIEASKCLGEIGALKINQTSYFFQVYCKNVQKKSEILQPICEFIECILDSLDKRMLHVKPNTLDNICEVLLYCINSINGEHFIEKFPLLSVYRKDLNCTSYIDEHNYFKNIEWIPCFKKSNAFGYEQWIQIFMSNIFTQCEWYSLANLAASDSLFAAAILLPFIKFLIKVDKCRIIEKLCILLDYFFKEFVECLNMKVENKTTNNCAIYYDKRIVNTFLNITECVRINNDWSLPVNCLNVSQACNYCQAYFMSIMYQELWTSSELAKDHLMCSSDILSDKNFQQCAIKAFQSIGCYDAIGGYLNPLNSRIECFDIENNWTDLLLEGESYYIPNELYSSILKRNGMLSLASLQQKRDNPDYEICWRLGQWDTVVDGSTKVNYQNDMEHEFSKHHFNALKSIYNREENNTLAALSNARDCVLSILMDISIECLQSVYKYLTWLHFIQHVEEFCKVQFLYGSDTVEFMQKWQRELDFQYGNFYFKEQIISHQIALFKMAGVRASRKIMEIHNENPVEKCLIKCIDECKKAGQLNLAKRNISVLRNITTEHEQNKLRAYLEDADVCFKTGKSDFTKSILQYILKTPDFLYCLERISALQMYGQYMMETNSEPFVVVSENYFSKSIELFSKIKDKIRQKFPNRYTSESETTLEVLNKKGAFKHIAKYADREYSQVNAYMNSPEFKIKCRIIRENREAANLVGKNHKDRDKLVGALNLKKFANLDEIDVQNIDHKRTENLCISIENYIRYCTIDESDSSSFIYRIIALWFANKENECLHSKIVEYIFTIPSYKFVCALNQITGRLNSKAVQFLTVVKSLLVRCVQEHPHHTLYQLYPLVFAHIDSNEDQQNHVRNNNAKDILTAARCKNNSNCYKQMEAMFSALIEFANTSPPENKKSSITIGEKLKKLKLLDNVQCPTLPLTVSPNLVYNITSIIKWDNNVSMVGGINAPKKIVCLCSDGVSRPQLLKGKDDLRQDAVMQQVFLIINDLLKNELKAVERNLVLRTYKVTPLSMRSGILEWCENTIPIGIYLAGDGKGGAHKKYRPNDYTNLKCRQLSMTHLKSDIEKRYQVYSHICENIKPVFHYFWFENFHIPGVWFERRLAYINSVATTSIVGFILGLGDRHTQNILIDEKTAELIHIDFGIAFDQGRVMPTPETIPFRLTRDIVAPMGVCGTNGLFKSSCEITMEILQQNQSVITTILEVLLYDPLYIWKIVAPTNTNTENDEQNLTAQRALLIVQDKLEGKQPGFFGTANIDVYVQRLINDAVSARNLCQLYPGWDPYL